MATPPPAGWYDDPKMVNTRRYWDGAKWTEHRQEKAAAAAPVVVQADEPSRAAVGWGVAFAILIPFVGFFIGLALLGKRGNDGIKIVVVSVACFFLWLFILSAIREANQTDCVIDNANRAANGQPLNDCG